MSREFSQNIVGNGKIIDFHTHPYRHRGEFMGMYGEHFYLEPEQMPADLAEAGISVFCGSVIDSDHRGAMESFDRVREVNDAALQLREKFGSAYVPGFHVVPRFSERIAACRTYEEVPEPESGYIGDRIVPIRPAGCLGADRGF